MIYDSLCENGNLKTCLVECFILALLKNINMKVKCGAFSPFFYFLIVKLLKTQEHLRSEFIFWSSVLFMQWVTAIMKWNFTVVLSGRFSPLEIFYLIVKVHQLFLYMTVTTIKETNGVSYLTGSFLPVNQLLYRFIFDCRICNRRCLF